MIINNALRKRIEKLLPKNYRKTIVDKLKERGIEIHPNTVYNVLHGSQNNEVSLEILRLYNEQKKLSDKAQAIVAAAA
jgi:IS30 family transposase